jgi:hypothetical protein
MHHARHLPRRSVLAALPVSLALLLAGLLFAGCESAVTEAGGPVSLQTSEALDLLPGGAQMVGMVDFAAARNSNALEQVMGGELSPFGADGSNEMDRFIRLTGFDPATDLDRVYVAGSPETEAAALVAYARFDRDRIERAIEQEAPEGEMARTEIEGVPAWIAQEAEGPAFAFALPNDRMMVAGDEPTVRAMLARLASGGQGLTADADLMALVERARHKEGAWFVVRGMGQALPTPPASGGDPMDRLGGQAEDVVVSVGFGDDGVGVDAYIAPRPGAAASDVADVARAAVSAMRMQAKAEPVVLDMLDEVEVGEEGAGVRVTAFVPQAVLAEMKAESMRDS